MICDLQFSVSIPSTFGSTFISKSFIFTSSSLFLDFTPLPCAIFPSSSCFIFSPNSRPTAASCTSARRRRRDPRAGTGVDVQRDPGSLRGASSWIIPGPVLIQINLNGPWTLIKSSVSSSNNSFFAYFLKFNPKIMIKREIFLENIDKKIFFIILKMLQNGLLSCGKLSFNRLKIVPMPIKFWKRQT